MQEPWLFLRLRQLSKAVIFRFLPESPKSLPSGVQRVNLRALIERAFERSVALDHGRINLVFNAELESSLIRCPAEELETLFNTLFEAMAAFTPGRRAAVFAHLQEETKGGRRFLTFDLASPPDRACLRLEKSILGQFGRYGWRLAAGRKRIEAYGGALAGIRARGREGGVAFQLRLPSSSLPLPLAWRHLRGLRGGEVGRLLRWPRGVS